MTDNELKKLKRPELLELMLYMREEIEKLQKENEELKKNIAEANSNHDMLEKIMKAVCHESSPDEKTEISDEQTAENITEKESKPESDIIQDKTPLEREKENE